MRIAFVYDAIYPQVKGGIEKRIFDVSTRLVDRGHEVHIVGLADQSTERTTESQGRTVRGLQPLHAPYSTSGKRSAIQAVGFAFAIVLPLIRGRYDVVEVQSATPLAGLMTWIASGLGGYRVVVVWHEFWGDHWISYAGLLGQIARFLEWLLSRTPAVHIAVSDTTARKLAGSGVDVTGVVSLGVDRDRLERIPPAEVDVDIICVARLVKGKNVALLLRAIAVLEDRGLDVRCLIVGEGPEHSHLEELAVSLRLSSAQLVGAVPDWSHLMSLIKSARALALPSRREGFGLVVLEAAACGVPTVGIDEFENAARSLVYREFLSPNDPDEFANHLHLALFEDDTRVAALGYLDEVVARHDLNATVDSMEGIYQDLARAAA